MRLVATIVENGKKIGLVHGPDACDQEITVNGRIWRFDFDRYCGPLWLRKDGQARKCQCPGKPVWKEWGKWFERWSKRNKRGLS